MCITSGPHQQSIRQFSSLSYEQTGHVSLQWWSCCCLCPLLCDMRPPLRLILLSSHVYSYTTAARAFHCFLFVFPLQQESNHISHICCRTSAESQEINVTCLSAENNKLLQLEGGDLTVKSDMRHVFKKMIVKVSGDKIKKGRENMLSLLQRGNSLWFSCGVQQEHPEERHHAIDNI